MIAVNSCPRCKGAVLEHGGSYVDSAMCLNCGWRKAEVPTEVLKQVKNHLGDPYMEDRYTHTRIGTGKPPLSGWDRVKRRREREKARQEAALSRAVRIRHPGNHLTEHKAPGKSQPG